MPRSKRLSNIKLSYCSLTYVLHDSTEKVFTLTRPLFWITLCPGSRHFYRLYPIMCLVQEPRNNPSRERSILLLTQNTPEAGTKHSHFLYHHHRCVHATNEGQRCLRFVMWGLPGTTYPGNKRRRSCCCHILQKLLTQHQDCDTRSLHQTRYLSTRNSRDTDVL